MKNVLLFVIALNGSLTESTLHAGTSAEVVFDLYRTESNSRVFRIRNVSNHDVQLDGMFPYDSGYSFTPAYATYEGFSKGKLVESHSQGGDDVLISPYPLHPGDTIYFQLAKIDGSSLTQSNTARLRLGRFVTGYFSVLKAQSRDIKFRLLEVNEESMVFRLQNGSEVEIELPSIHNMDEEYQPFEVAEMEIQSKSGKAWDSLPKKIKLGETNPDFVPARETLIFKVPREHFTGFKKGSLLRVKIGAFYSQSFKAP